MKKSHVRIICHGLDFRQEMDRIMISSWLQEGRAEQTCCVSPRDGRDGMVLQEKRWNTEILGCRWSEPASGGWTGSGIGWTVWALHMLHTEYDEERRLALIGCWGGSGDPVLGCHWSCSPAAWLGSPREHRPTFSRLMQGGILGNIFIIRKYFYYTQIFSNPKSAELHVLHAYVMYVTKGQVLCWGWRLIVGEKYCVTQPGRWRGS